jgi:hypothetical protein
MVENRVTWALGRLAEILVEHCAKMSLNEIRDILDAQPCAEGFRDGETSAEDRRQGPSGSRRSGEGRFIGSYLGLSRASRG